MLPNSAAPWKKPTATVAAKDKFLNNSREINGWLILFSCFNNSQAKSKNRPASSRILGLSQPTVDQMVIPNNRATRETIK